jgi:hypothetical protein
MLTLSPRIVYEYTKQKRLGVRQNDGRQNNKKRRRNRGVREGRGGREMEVFLWILRELRG